MQVTIRNVNVEWAGEGRKKYGKAVVEYTYNGEARRQNIMSFSNPDVFKKVQELTGQTVEVEVGKNDKGYSEWRSISVGVSNASNAGSPAATATTRVSGSNYETREERAARQVMIAKQSSLDRAVEILKHNNPKDKIDPEEAKRLAQDLTDFVLGAPNKTEDKSGFDNMDDDIPF
jgi:hypothetical protein